MRLSWIAHSVLDDSKFSACMVYQFTLEIFEHVAAIEIVFLG